MDANDKFMHENDDLMSMESDEYRKGYQNSIMQFQKQYHLRSKKLFVVSQKGNQNKDPQKNASSSNEPKNKIHVKDVQVKGKQQEEPPKKVPEMQRNVIIKEVEKIQPPFNFENEKTKIKIYIPFNELIKNVEYRSQIIKML